MLKGKVTVVVGALGGIGPALAAPSARKGGGAGSRAYSSPRAARGLGARKMLDSLS